MNGPYVLRIPGFPLDLWDAPAIARALAVAIREPGMRAEFREAIWTLRETAPTDEEDILHDLAEFIASGRVQVLRERTVVPPPAEPEEEAKKSPPLSKKSWIKIQIVDDLTALPVPSVKLKVKLTDKSECEATTDADGYVEYREIDPGTCEVWSEFKGRGTRSNTWGFVAAGVAAARDDSPRPGTGTKYIAKIEEHKVATGESIDSLAKGIGMTWQELAKFNWETDDPKRINRSLLAQVGCTKKVDKHNYRFDDSDDPGIVYLPREWRQAGLATEETHVFRVKLEREFVDVIVPLESDLDEDPETLDVVRLRAVDDSFVLVRKADDPDVKKTKDNCLLDYHFRDVPVGLYAVEVKIREEWFPVVLGIRVSTQGLFLGQKRFESGYDGARLGNPDDSPPDYDDLTEPEDPYMC